MKRRNLFHALCAVALSLSLTACGGDDDGGNGGNNGGGSYNPSKKLTKLVIKDLKVADEYSEEIIRSEDDKAKYDVAFGDFVYEIEYDTQGRLNRVVAKTGKKGVHNPDGTITIEDVPINADIATVDYDQSKITVPYVLRLDGTVSSKKELRFALNDKGYITQLGDYSIVYDADGYVKEVKETNKMWNTIYKNQEFIGWIEQELKSLSSQTYYVDYSNGGGKETTFIKIRDYPRHKYNAPNDIHERGYLESHIYYYMQKFLYVRAFLIAAYQYGWFGKTAKTYKSIAEIKDNPVNVVTYGYHEKYFGGRYQYQENETFRLDMEFQ